MKIIQITTTNVKNTQATQCNWVMHALCDDGRLFELTDTREWREIPTPGTTMSDVAERVSFAIAELGPVADNENHGMWATTPAGYAISTCLEILSGRHKGPFDSLHMSEKYYANKKVENAH